MTEEKSSFELIFGVSKNLFEQQQQSCQVSQVWKLPVKTGTSIMALSCGKNGVIIGADSRSSAGTYVANRLSDKLQKLTDKIYICRSGSTAHTQNIGNYVSHYLNIQSQELNEEVRVRTAAKLIQSLCYANKDWVSASIIIAGYDKYEGGQVYNCPLGGTLVSKVPYAIGGSGSSYIYGYCDSIYKESMIDSVKDCRNFVKDSLSRAVFRDGSSGGVIRTMHISNNGIHRDTTMPKYNPII